MNLIPTTILYSLFPGIDLAIATVGFFFFVRYLKYLNFAYAAFIPSAAYLVWSCGWNLYMIPVACIFVGVLAAFLEVIVMFHIRGRTDESLPLLLASLGLFTILVAVIQILWGPSTHILPAPFSGDVFLCGISIMKYRLIIFIFNCVLLLTTIAFIQFSRLGYFVRAIDNDPELAKISGIDVNKIRIIMAAVGASLGSWSGVSMGMDIGFSPLMGVETLFISAIAVALGGRSIVAAIACSMLIYTIMNIAAVCVPTHWSKTIVFVVFMIVMILRSRITASLKTGT